MAIELSEHPTSEPATVLRSLAQLPGFEAFMAEHWSELTLEATELMCSWKVRIEVDRLRSREPLDDLFEAYLETAKGAENDEVVELD